MKRVKLMLVSLSVLAVVAGAVAFKAKGTGNFCTAATSTIGQACPQNYACLTETKKLTTVNPNVWLCTTPTSGISGSPCTNLNCGTTSASVRIEP